MRTKWAALLVVTLWGCGDSTTTPPDGGVSLPPATIMSGANADYSCNGTRTDPAGNAQTYMRSGTVSDQLAGAQAGALIEVFRTVADAMSGTRFSMATSDGSGNFTDLMLPDHDYRPTFKMTKGTDALPTYEFDLPTQPGSTPLALNMLLKTTAAGLSGIVGVTYDGTKALIAGAVRDCGGNFVKGAIASVTVGGTAIPDTSVFYFMGQIPAPRSRAPYTDVNGLFTGVNITPGSSAVIEVRAVPTAGGAVTVVGRTTVPLIAGSLSIVELPPLAQ